MDMNERILEALGDERVIGVAMSVALQYNRYLTADEMNDCILQGVWKTLEYHDEHREDGCSFSSYLYRTVSHECLRYKDRVVLGHLEEGKSQPLTENLDIEFMTPEDIDMLDEIENSPDPEIMFDRYYNGMTISEIAMKNGSNRQNISRKIRKNLEFFRRRLSNSV